MDLQNPSSKMSTTGGSVERTVYVLDDEKTTAKKFKRAVTDSDDPPRIVSSPDKPGVRNLIDNTTVDISRIRALMEVTRRQPLPPDLGSGMQ